MGGHVLKNTAKNLGWRLIGGAVNECESCAIAKAKQRKVPKYSEDKRHKPGASWNIDISSIKI